jgi:hypothetical protein
MRYALALLFFVHGFAHTVGFVVPWRIATLEDMPYKTTVLNDKLNLGNWGIRLVGLLWLLAALLFFVVGALLIGRMDAWLPLALGTSLFSLTICVLGVPDSRIGLAVNLVILAFVLLGVRLGWLEALGL